MVENDERISTASTVSGIYRNILKSPAPICMFYFAHPFGVASPFSADTEALKPGFANSPAQSDATQQQSATSCDGLVRGSAYTPWPERTWRRDVLSPLVRLLATHMGHNVPDLETLIHSIRLAWNSPTCRSVLQSGSFNFVNRSTEQETIPHTIIMGSGSYGSLTGAGLLRRRYSVPEIIMRKHSLARQRSVEDNDCNSSAPSTQHASPTAAAANHRPPSHRPPRNSTGTQFETSSPAIAVDRIYDPPQSPFRQPNCDTSMRRQLLRRIWSKEFRQSETRSGSWSPPLRRSQRRLNVEPMVDDKCAECMKLEKEYASCGSLRSVADSTQNGLSCLGSAATSLDEVHAATTRPRKVQNYPETSTVATASTDRFISSSETRHVTTTESLSLAAEEETYPTKMPSPPIFSVTTGESHANVESLQDLESSHPDMESIYDENQYSFVTNDERMEKSTIPERYPESDTNPSDATSTPRDQAEHMEENGNNTAEFMRNEQDALVDQYIANLLIDSLNNVINATHQAQDLYPKPETVTNTSELEIRQYEEHVANDIEGCEAENLEITTELKPPMIVDQYSQMSTTMYIPELDHNYNGEDPCPIYFPRYSAESETNQSVFSSVHTDNDPECFDRVEVIAVHSGSNYPNGECQIGATVSRLVRRTESMEAQRASTSPYNGDSDNSLVDSLDDPSSPRPDATKQSKCTVAPVQYEKSQTFFVPILDSNNAPTTGESVDMASAMPNKLREKMMKRLHSMDTKKQNVTSKKLKKFERRLPKKQATELSNKPKKMAELLPHSAKAIKSKFLRAEIGFLETYKIDARGNLQFEAPAKSKTSLKTQYGTRTTSSSQKQRPLPKKSSNPTRRSDVISIKRSQTKKSTITTSQKRKEVVRDVQHMTLYQSDLVTPDTECGPRRMYQKTEILDGEKRIEILEIVECIDSSSCGSSPDERTVDPITGFISSASQVRRSKIPIPVCKTSGTEYRKPTKYASRENSPGHIFVKNIQKLDTARSGNTKVDQMIADLLIEALNHPKELGIEFVKSPTEYLRSTNSSGGTKRMMVGRKTISPGSPTLGSAGVSRRSSNTSAVRYQQVFDVIPEEKSSSMSVDSSTEECGLGQKEMSKAHCGVNANVVGNELAIEKTTEDIVSAVTTGSEDSSGSSFGRVARGKEAVESQSEAAWIGFFKQHDDSSATTEDTFKGSSYVNESAMSTTTTTTLCLTNESPAITRSSREPHTTTTTSTTSKTMFTLTPTISSHEQLTNTSAGSDAIISVIERLTLCETTTPYTPIESSVISTAEHPPTYLTTTNCAQCRMIDMEIYAMPSSKINNLQRSLDVVKAENRVSTQKYYPPEGNDEDVWQVAKIGSKDPVKNALSPIESVPSEKPATRSSGGPAEIDSTSFIILRDDVASSKGLPFATKTNQTPDEGGSISADSRQRCSDCCFCNPELHKRSRSISRTSCSYCDRLNSKWKASTPRSNSQEANTKGTNTRAHQFYDTLSKTEHTHIRTRSKESDTVSLKCTRINSKIRRIVPEDSLNGNVFEDKENDNQDSYSSTKSKDQNMKATAFNNNPSNPPRVSAAAQKGTTTSCQQAHGSKNNPHLNYSKTCAGGVPLPSAFIKNAHSTSNSYDSASTTSSSSHCSSSVSSNHTSPNKRCLTLPAARWQSHHSAGQPSTTRKSTAFPESATNQIRASRYQDFYGHPKSTERREEIDLHRAHKETAESSNQQTVVSNHQQKSGWSLTLAGTYRDDMAPDVEMRLSFPKRSPTNGSESLDRNRIHNELLTDNHPSSAKLKKMQNTKTNNNVFYDEETAASNRSSRPPPIEDTMNGFVNSKRTLSKANAARPNRINCNLPEVNTFDRDVARQTARKTIKRSDYSVAVASATTKTISKFGNGKRAMSYQTLNANAIRIDNRERNHRDHSLDLGNLSSRRMSLDSPSVTASEGMVLSILGNAIAPEQKPRVPTMSERDLTRKPHSCFTRNRTLFS